MLSGFNLIQLETDYFTLEILADDERDDKELSGTFAQVVAYAVLLYKFSINEIELSILEMCKNGHNVACFGRYGGFLYSENRSVTYRRVS